MSNYFLLLKIFFKEKFSLNNSRKSSSLALIILTIVLLLGCSFYFNYMFMQVYSSINMTDQYIILMTGMTCSITFFTSFFRAKDVLFSVKDHNILVPMPINKKTIIGAKLSFFYLEELLFSLLFMLPTLVFYTQMDRWYLLLGTIGMIFVPLITVVISVAIGFIVTLLTNRFQKAKTISNIIYILIYLGFIIFIFFVSYSTNSEMANQINNVISIILPFLKWVELGIIDHDILYVCLLVGFAILSTAIIVVLYSLFYEKFYQALFIVESKRKFNSKDIKTSPLTWTMFKKDIATLVSNPMVLLGCFVGSILALIMPFLLRYTPFESQDPDEIMLYYYVLGLVMPGILAVISSISNYTAFAITLEKQGISIIKSLPISSKKFVLSKLIVNQTIVGSLTLIASIITCVLFPLDIFIILEVILMPQIYILGMGMYGLILNFHYYKINWSSYNEIKNSVSSVIYSLTALLFGALTIVISLIGLFAELPSYVTFIISILYVIALTIGFGIPLFKKSPKWLLQISC